MSNMFSNRLSVTIADTDMQALRSYVQQMEAALPFLIGLTDEERSNLPKINRENKLFVDDALLGLRENAHLVPAYLDVVEVEKDVQLFEQLSELEQLILLLLTKLSHTRILAGSEAFQACLSFYRSAKDAARTGYPGAEAVSDRLGRRFKLRRNLNSPAIDMEAEGDGPVITPLPSGGTN